MRIELRLQMDYSPDKVKCYGPGIEETVVPKQETHFTIDTTKVPLPRKTRALGVKLRIRIR